MILFLKKGNYFYNYYLKFSTFTKDYPSDKIVDNKYFCNKKAGSSNELKMHYNFTLICRENPLSNNFIKLICNSHDNEGVIYFTNFYFY